MPERLPAGPSRHLPARIAALADAQAFLDGRLADSGLDAASASRLALALEEVFVDICHYGYPEDAPGTIELRAWTEDDRFVLEIVDQGQPFDGQSLPDPDIAASLEERPIGGLGWFLVRRMVSALEYQRRDGHNVTRLVMTSMRPDHAGPADTDRP